MDQQNSICDDSSEWHLFCFHISIILPPFKTSHPRLVLVVVVGMDRFFYLRLDSKKFIDSMTHKTTTNLSANWKQLGTARTKPSNWPDVMRGNNCLKLSRHPISIVIRSNTLGIGSQSTKQDYKDNKFSPWQRRLMIPNDMRTRMDHAKATCCGPIFTVEQRKLDKYRCMTWQRGSAPWDVAPAMNYRDIRPSTHRWNQPTQSRGIDVKAQSGWTEVRRSTTPSGIERTKV